MEGVKEEEEGANPVDGFMKTLEEERDYWNMWKGEVDVFNIIARVITGLDMMLYCLPGASESCKL